MEEFPQCLQIAFRVDDVGKAMAGAGDGDQPLAGGAGIVIFLAHPARYEIVAFAMEEDHWHGAAFDGGGGIGGIQIKMTKELSS